jgi:glycogen operon protein
MLLGGDELGRTQQGNNNAYDQDNEVSWYDWDRARDHTVLLEFTQRLAKLRREHPVFRRRRFFHGRPLHGGDVADIGWYRPDGQQMDDDDWESGFAKSVTVFLNGEAINEPDARGERIVDDSFFLLFNAHHEPLGFVLPEGDFGDSYVVEVDTAQPVPVEDRTVKPGGDVTVEARSIVVLRRSW